MANTLFAEKNRVNWIGVRPGVYGEQILKHAENVVVDTILYTVPAGKTLLMFGCWIQPQFSTAAGAVSLLIRDLLDATVYIAIRAVSISGVGDIQASVRDFTIPIEIAAGFDIFIDITAAGCPSSVGIEGLLIIPSENT
jgi:hypothetical protein